MDVNECRIIELPKFLDERGNLSFVENFAQIPFEIKRTYWLYDVPGGVARGGHAEMRNKELIIALSGAFEIVVDDGRRQKITQLTVSIGESQVTITAQTSADLQLEIFVFTQKASFFEAVFGMPIVLKRKGKRS